MSRKFLLKVAAVAAAVPIAMSVFMTAAVPASKAEAKGLTQVTDGSKVVYGTASASDIALLKKIFDFEYYKAQNPELVELLGNNYNALFTHFYKYGIFEGRTCNAGFDPSAYVAAYADAKDAAAGDILKAYVHFINVGLPESRPLCTLAACASAGITVESIVDDSVKITPEVYKVAQQLGIDDYQTVNEAIEIAKQQAAAGNEVVITTSTAAESGSSGDDSTVSGNVGTISVGKYIHIIVFKGSTAGYGAYSVDESWGTVGDEIDKTSDFDGNYAGKTRDENFKYDGVDPVAQVVVGAHNGETPIVLTEVISGDGVKEDSTDDPSQTESTKYEVGFEFTESSDDSVSFEISYEGSDGFSAKDEYKVAVSDSSENTPDGESEVSEQQP